MQFAVASTAAANGPLSHESTGEESSDKPVVEAEAVTVAVDRALLRYDRDGDEHHDVASAFIRSMRGSDPDAALHYLSRMIEAGEDPRFIARWLVVHAAEDVGLADPQALQVAVAAAEAAQLVGLPEARIPLAEAAIYIAIASKSNATIAAIDAAISDVRRGKIGVVPKYLRHSHNRGASCSDMDVATSLPTTISVVSCGNSTFPTSWLSASTTSHPIVETSGR